MQPMTQTRANTTGTLLSRARAGDHRACETLYASYLPILTRWAHGRLPPYARGLNETNDLVQTTLLRALNHLGNLACEREGAFLAYLRRIFLNAVRDEIRNATRHPHNETFEEQDQSSKPAISPELVADYERGLLALAEVQREAVILRIEFGFSFAEVAAAIGAPSTNAARMMVSRALIALAEAMA